MSLAIHYLQNLDTAGIGNIEQWATERGHRLSGTRLYQSEPLPDLSNVDVLVILGGVPQNCKEWLENEIDFIRQAIDSDKGVVGICLGSQLIACAMGGELIEHTYAESGWLNVEFNAQAKSHPLLEGVDSRKLFFFHRNTVVLPPVFSLHASTKGCANQVFTCNERVIGIQAHPEMLNSTIAQLAQHRADDLPDGPYHQISLGDDQQQAYLKGAKQLIWQVLDNLVEVIS